MAGSVLVKDVNGISTVVDITTVGGSPTELPVFSDKALTQAVTLPVTITADTTFYLAVTGGVLLSVKVNGTEIAGPLEVFLTNAGPVAFSLDPDPRNADAERLMVIRTAASSALHATKIAQVSKSGPVTVTAGGSLTLGFNNGGTITAGDAYWGSPNTALPLDITITAGGGVILPDDDATYDLYAFATVTCDVADAGKMLGIFCAGNDSNGYGWVPAPAAGGAVTVDVFMTTRVFAGDGPYDHVGVAIDAAHMTQNVTVDSFNLFVSKR